MSEQTTTLRPEEQRTAMKLCTKLLTVGDTENPAILDVHIRMSQGLDVTANYAQAGAGEAAGKTASTEAAIVMDLTAFDLIEELGRSVRTWGAALGMREAPKRDVIQAWAKHVTEQGTPEELSDTFGTLTRVTAGFERLYGRNEPLPWGYACPNCAAHYTDAELDSPVRLAPIYGGAAVLAGEWCVRCTECSFIMSKTQAKVRATRALAKLAGSSRLSSKWRKAVNGARKDLMSANKRFEEEGRDEDSEAAQAAGRRTVWLIEQLWNGEYFRMNATTEELEAAAA